MSSDCDDLPMNLRDRIAAAIYTDNAFGWTEYQCGVAADAVIEELGLQPLGLQPDGSFIDATGVVWRHTGKDWTNDQTYRP